MDLTEMRFLKGS